MYRISAEVARFEFKLEKYIRGMYPDRRVKFIARAFQLGVITDAQLWWLITVERVACIKEKDARAIYYLLGDDFPARPSSMNRIA